MGWGRTWRMKPCSWFLNQGPHISLYTASGTLCLQLCPFRPGKHSWVSGERSRGRVWRPMESKSIAEMVHSLPISTLAVHYLNNIWNSNYNVPRTGLSTGAALHRMMRKKVTFDLNPKCHLIWSQPGRSGDWWSNQKEQGLQASEKSLTNSGFYCDMWAKIVSQNSDHDP